MTRSERHARRQYRNLEYNFRVYERAGRTACLLPTAIAAAAYAAEIAEVHATSSQMQTAWRALAWKWGRRANELRSSEGVQVTVGAEGTPD